jgi:phospholipid/cholesterol/gamma-HCH transport system substrate-binding protein
VLAVGGLVVAVVLLAVLLLGGGSAYTMHIRFLDAGQLVPGDLVEVSAHEVGTIKAITLSKNNQADVKIEVNDDRYLPLREGTTATIRAVSLVGVANRFVELSPGPASGTKLPEGYTLPALRTNGIVDLDTLLDELDPKTRDQLQRIIRNGPKLFGGHPEAANTAFGYLNPALSEIRRLSAEIDTDEQAVSDLIVSSSQIVGALASRRDDLQSSVTNTARTLRAIASERTALGDAIARTPAVLRQAEGTLRNVRGTLTLVRPTLRQLRPVAAPLAAFIAELPSSAAAAQPVLADLRGQLPALRKVLVALPLLARVGIPALNSTTSTLNALLPITDQLRPYAFDVGAGLVNGLGAGTAGFFDANGHYARISLQTSPATPTGLLNLVLGGLSTSGLTGLRTGLTARCPGAGAATATDGSNPITPSPLTCRPGDSR